MRGAAKDLVSGVPNIAITQSSDAHGLSSQQTCGCAGACALISLPLDLLHKITQSLDLRSQRNLFLCSCHLYSKWQLYIPDDLHWRFVQPCIDLFETASGNSICDGITLAFSGTSTCWYITCQSQQQSRQFNLKHSAITSSGSRSARETDWSGMTKDQLWHRLTGAPDLASAELSCTSHLDLLPRSDGLKALAQQTFDLLCTAKGLLLIVMKGLKGPQPQEIGEGWHTLHITHSADPLDENVLHWEIDNQKCIVDPPKFVFVGIPEEVKAMRACFYSYNPSRHQLSNTRTIGRLYPQNHVLHDFAYGGNVDCNVDCTSSSPSSELV